MKLAPVVLFIYNRPEHTRHTLEALSENALAEQSALYIFADGPKADGSSDEREKIERARMVAGERKWCGRVELFASDSNKGLADSVILGVSKVIEEHGRVIVLEDDLVTSPYFLTYMNQCLDIYRNSPNIYSVSANMFNVDTPMRTTVLLPYIATWGWGSWKEKWSTCDWSAGDSQFILENRHMRRRFNLADYDYASQLLLEKRNA